MLRQPNGFLSMTKTRGMRNISIVVEFSLDSQRFLRLM